MHLQSLCTNSCSQKLVLHHPHKILAVLVLSLYRLPLPPHGRTEVVLDLPQVVSCSRAWNRGQCMNSANCMCIYMRLWISIAMYTLGIYVYIYIRRDESCRCTSLQPADAEFSLYESEKAYAYGELPYKEYSSTWHTMMQKSWKKQLLPAEKIN